MVAATSVGKNVYPKVVPVEGIFGWKIWLADVAYKAMPFRKIGYGKVPLNKFQALMVPYPKIAHLAKQEFTDTSKTSNTDNSKSHWRFHIHFLAKQFKPTLGKDEPEAFEMFNDLLSFYGRNVDLSKLFTTLAFNAEERQQYINLIVNHLQSIHIVVTALPGNEESPAIKEFQLLH